MARAGIPTTHDGIVYRSRLEARWAYMFDQLGWPFIYEPFDAEGYIPDFLIQGDDPFLVEVKPAATLAEYYQQSERTFRALQGHWQYDVLILGLGPTIGDNWAGLLGEFGAPGRAYSEGAWAIDEAGWMRCVKCGRFAVYHSVHSYRGRPCGHYDGDHYASTLAYGHIDNLWKQATNATKWAPR